MTSSRLSAITPKLPKGVIAEALTPTGPGTPWSLRGAGTASPNFCVPASPNFCVQEATFDITPRQSFGGSAIGSLPSGTSQSVAAAARWHQGLETAESQARPVLLGRSAGECPSGPPSPEEISFSSETTFGSETSFGSEESIQRQRTRSNASLADESRLLATRAREAYLERKRRVDGRTSE